MKPTDISQFLNDLNAGVFAAQAGKAISDVAAGTVEYGKKGKVTITLEFSQIGESNQVKINHKLDYTEPTRRGSKREDTALDTPMYVTSKGVQIHQLNPTIDLFCPKEAPVLPQEV